MKVLGMFHWHTNSLSLHSSWYWKTFTGTFIQFSCQIAQFLMSKNRQKGDQFFNQMSDFCKNYYPHFSYHTTAVGECLVDIWFAETCQTDFCLHFKRFLSVWNMRVYCMLKQAVWACSFVLTSLLVENTSHCYVSSIPHDAMVILH